MRAIYVPLSIPALDKLGKLAREERRHPKDTAALLLEKVLNDIYPELAPDGWADPSSHDPTPH